MNLFSKIKKKFDRKIFSKILKKIDRLSLTDLDERRRNNIFNFHRNDYKFDQNKFVFIHTPKIAGSSVQILLQDKIKDKLFKWERKSKHHPVSLLCPPGPKYKYITFLRNPIDRVFSYYNTSIMSKRTTRHSIAKRGLSELLINCWEVRNMYCQYLSGYVREEVNSEIYDIAKKNLENFFFVGEFENFEEDLKKLSKKLNFNLDKTPHVVVYSKTHHLIKNQDHVSLISSYNNYDLKIYKYFLELKKNNIF